MGQNGSTPAGKWALQRTETLRRREAASEIQTKIGVARSRRALFTTLDLGRLKDGVRMKGNAVIPYGGKDTGEGTITDSFLEMYHRFLTPPADNMALLMRCRGREPFLWQDFRYNPGHPGRKEDVGLQVDEGTMNRMWEGLPTLFEVLCFALRRIHVNQFLAQVSGECSMGDRLPRGEELSRGPLAGPVCIRSNGT